MPWVSLVKPEFRQDVPEDSSGDDSNSQHLQNESHLEFATKNVVDEADEIPMNTHAAMKSVKYVNHRRTGDKRMFGSICAARPAHVPHVQEHRQRHDQR